MQYTTSTVFINYCQVRNFALRETNTRFVNNIMKNPDFTSILPFTSDQKKLVEDLLHSFDDQQLTWLAGYLSGISLPQSIKTIQAQSQPNRNPGLPAITVLYASRTGNGAAIAKKLKAEAESKGISVRLEDMNEYTLSKLKDEKYVLVIVSTHGEGVPPVAAEEFYEFLHGKRAPKLTNIKFSVLALGDRSYVHFCKTGQELDKKIGELGAERLHPRVDCDVDFQATSDMWIHGVVSKLASHIGSAASSSVVINGAVKPEMNGFPEIKESVYTKLTPFKTKILNKIKLTGRGSEKEIFHYEISLENSGFSYEPGDSLGVYPINSSYLVNEVLHSLKVNAKTIVNVGKTEKSLEEALTHNFELSVISPDVMANYNAYAKNTELQHILDDSTKLKEYVYGRDLVDLTMDFPVSLSAENFVGILRKLHPRLYSIASSSKAYPDEVHLTVSAVRYKNGRYKEGTCSTFLSDRLLEDQEISVYLERNSEFRLPANSDAPVIMIGPGTGIAPYRSFLQDREANGSKGKNWLFFGDRHFSTDFLYQTEFQNYYKKGILTRFNVAFSRDTNKKVYVQHKMLEHSKELYSWLEEGAYFYVCGDMKNMWNDVNKTLTEIIAKEGGHTAEIAGDYVKLLKKSKRYQVDIY